MGKCLKKCQNYRFFDIFLNILHKMKESLGQEHVKGGFYPSREKTGTIFAAVLGKMTVFQVCPYLSTHPSIKSGFRTYTKIIFLKSAITVLLARKVS